MSKFTNASTAFLAFSSHPGFAATSKSYDGDVAKLRPPFRTLLKEYITRVFQKRLTPKKIHGRFVSAKELGEFIKAYVKLFKDATIFPEAKTLLAATTEANNRAAFDVALHNYKAEMDTLVGINWPYCSEAKLMEHHEVCLSAAVTKFETIATIDHELTRLHSSISFATRSSRGLQSMWTSTRIVILLSLSLLSLSHC